MAFPIRDFVQLTTVLANRYNTTLTNNTNNIMKLRFNVAVLATLVVASEAFQSSLPTSTNTMTTTADSSSALFMAKSRKARRMQKVEKQGKSRPQFFDAIEDAAKEETAKVSPPDDDDDDDDEDRKRREAQAAEARRRMDERPEVSTLIVDEETGIEVVAQGKSVMDVVTRKAVQLSNKGPEYRLAQMFPGVPPEIREKHRVNWKTVEVPDMVEALRKACSVKLQDGTVGIPPHPSVANEGIDFVLANRDLLGYKMKKTLGRLTMRSMWKGNVEEGRQYKKLWKNFLTLENHISAPFRQMIMDGESRVGPNFGNLDLMAFCDGELYERVANYLVLKGMVAHWEKKVRDADYVEKTPQRKDNFVTVLSIGDPRRYLPDPPILYTLRECTQVCLMAQKMCKTFVDNEKLFGDFPPEIRFLEKALTIKGGTPLRKFMIEEFCPTEGITPEALREGMRRLYQQLENMQLDPYGDITNVVDKLNRAMAVGSDDERDPYKVYLANPSPDGPGYFQTYTFNHDSLSLVRFLDSQYERESGGGASAAPQSVEFTDFFNFGGEQNAGLRSKEQEKTSSVYKVPAARAAGRPHDLGWLDLLAEDKEEQLRLGKIPAGKIIVE